MPTPSQHAFSEKVALVVNAATPAGRAVSMQLGLYGSYVVAAHGEIGRSDERAVDELRSLGTLAHSIRAESETAEGAAALVRQVGEIYGRLDLLVNCLDSPSAEEGSAGLEGLEEAVASVLAPAYYVTRSAAGLFEGRPKGAIVNVLRYDAAADPLRLSVNAAAEKLTSAFAAEFPAGIRVNAVSIREDRARPRSAAEDLDPDLFRPRPAVDPDDVARAVVYLLSPEAKAVDGQVLEIG